jgi:hypothetical protein
MPTDLVLLVADKNIESGIRVLLSRPGSLQIRAIASKIYVHPQRDPACARRAHEFLRPFAQPHVYRLTRSGFADADEAAEHWRLDGDEAVFQRRHAVERIAVPHEVVFYTSCYECKPVLIRHDRPNAWGDLIGEHHLWVEFRLTFEPGEPRLIERISGTRDDLASELREEGFRVLHDDEPLAIAHDEIRTARNEASPRRSRRRR